MDTWSKRSRQCDFEGISKKSSRRIPLSRFKTGSGRGNLSFGCKTSMQATFIKGHQFGKLEGHTEGYNILSSRAKTMERDAKYSTLTSHDSNTGKGNCRYQGMTDRAGQDSSPVVLLMLIASLSLLVPSYASIGDSDPLYRTCVENCEKYGCVEEICFSSCKLPVNGASVEGAWFMQEPLYLRWKEWDCRIDCRYHCMVKRESEREILGQKPVKYHGKWPFKRVFGFQEPVSVAFSALNLAMQFHGWLSFVILVYYKLPLRPHNRSTYYEFTGLWNIYGILSMNAWLWSAVFHSRDVELTEKLDYSSAVALMGFSLIVAILRTFDVKDEAARVMVAAPLIAFVTTHILYLNFYELDYGLNMKVCVIMGVLQLLMWAVWACVSSHRAWYKVLTVVIVGGLAMLLEIYDFPPVWGYVDAHAAWHATTVPLTYIWWSFIKDDAVFRTSKLIGKSKDKNESRKVQ